MTQIYEASDIGRRSSMEDESLIISDFLGDGRVSLYCVFDGHAGDYVSKYLKANFAECLKQALVECGGLEGGKIEDALRQSFVACNEQMRRDPFFSRFPESEDDPDYEIPAAGGSTAAVVLLVDNSRVYVANAGDAEVVLLQLKPTKETSEKELVEENDDVVCLTTLHKPNVKSEHDRIKAAGGFVAMGRVNGLLAVSRSFGDFDFDGSVIVDPDVQQRQVREGDCIVVACDGLWDVFSYELAVNRVKQITNEKNIALMLVEEAIQVRHSTDNVSVIVVRVGPSSKKDSVEVQPLPLRLGSPRPLVASEGSNSWADMTEQEDDHENDQEEDDDEGGFKTVDYKKRRKTVVSLVKGDDNQKDTVTEPKEKKVDAWNVVLKKNQRQCSVCEHVFDRSGFSFSQLKKDKSRSKCLGCAEKSRLAYEAENGLLATETPITSAPTGSSTDTKPEDKKDDWTIATGKNKNTVTGNETRSRGRGRGRGRGREGRYKERVLQKKPEFNHSLKNGEAERANDSHVDQTDHWTLQNELANDWW